MIRVWNQFWHQPVEAIRLVVFARMFLGLLAFDLWMLHLPRAARYGFGNFNVAHFAWLDEIAPEVTSSVYAGLVLLSGLLSLVMAIAGPRRFGLVLLAGMYTFAWSMSMLDGFQHHYLISLMLFCMIFFPLTPSAVRSGRNDALPAVLPSSWSFLMLGATLAIAYAFAAISKSDASWRSGQTLEMLSGSNRYLLGIVDLATACGLSAAAVWKFIARSVIAAEWLAAATYLALPPRMGDQQRWMDRLRLLAWAMIVGLHLGIEMLGFQIGWFSWYMVLAASCFLLPNGCFALLARVAAMLPRVLARRLGVDRRSTNKPGISIYGFVMAGLGILLLSFLGKSADLPGTSYACVLAGVAVLGLALYGQISPNAGWKPLPLFVATAPAIAAMSMAVLLSSVRAEYYLELGSEWERTQQPNQALTAYKKALDYCHRAALAQSVVNLHLGRLHTRQGGHEIATRHLQQALQLNPKLYQAQVQLGIMSQAAGDEAQAMKYYRRALAECSSDPEAHFRLGTLYARKHACAQAMRHFQAVLESRPCSADAHYNLAVILGRQREMAGAEQHYRATLELNPGFWQAALNLANLLVRQSRNDEALIWYEAVLRQQPDHAGARHNLESLSSVSARSNQEFVNAAKTDNSREPAPGVPFSLGLSR